MREIFEETGIGCIREVEGFRAESRYRFQRENVPVDKVVVYFLAESRTIDVQLSVEHTESDWLEAKDARVRLTYEEGRRILDEAEACLSADLEGSER